MFSCAGSREEVEKEIREGIAFHLEEDLREGKEMPLQTAHDAGTVEVAVPSVVAP